MDRSLACRGPPFSWTFCSIAQFQHSYSVSLLVFKKQIDQLDGVLHRNFAGALINDQTDVLKC